MEEENFKVIVAIKNITQNKIYEKLICKIQINDKIKVINYPFLDSIFFDIDHLNQLSIFKLSFEYKDSIVNTIHIQLPQEIVNREEIELNREFSFSLVNDPLKRDVRAIYYIIILNKKVFLNQCQSNQIVPQLCSSKQYQSPKQNYSSHSSSKRYISDYNQPQLNRNNYDQCHTPQGERKQNTSILAHSQDKFKSGYSTQRNNNFNQEDNQQFLANNLDNVKYYSACKASNQIESLQNNNIQFNDEQYNTKQKLNDQNNSYNIKSNQCLQDINIQKELYKFKNYEIFHLCTLLDRLEQDQIICQQKLLYNKENLYESTKQYVQYQSQNSQSELNKEYKLQLQQQQEAFNNKLIDLVDKQEKQLKQLSQTILDQDLQKSQLFTEKSNLLQQINTLNLTIASKNEELNQQQQQNQALLRQIQLINIKENSVALLKEQIEALVLQLKDEQLRSQKLLEQNEILERSLRLATDERNLLETRLKQQIDTIRQTVIMVKEKADNINYTYSSRLRAQIGTQRLHNNKQYYSVEDNQIEKQNSLEKYIDFADELLEQIKNEKQQSHDIDQELLQLQQKQNEFKEELLIQFQVTNNKDQNQQQQKRKQVKGLQLDLKNTIEDEYQIYAQQVKQLIDEQKTYEPHKGDNIDIALSEYINSTKECLNQLRFLFVRLGQGVYQFGHKTIFMKLENEKLLVKYGSGFIKIEQFLERFGLGELEKLQKFNIYLESKKLIQAKQIQNNNKIKSQAQHQNNDAGNNQVSENFNPDSQNQVQ